MSLINRCSFFVKRIALVLKSMKLIYRQGGYTKVEVKCLARSEILKNRTILITGGGSGIGLAIAKSALEHGAKVVICGRNENKLFKVCQELDNSNLKFIVLDITKVECFEDKIQEASALIDGEIDVLINNAGVIDGNDFLNVSEKKWDEIYSVNAKGMYFLTQSMVGRWLKNQVTVDRKVINISSQGAFVGATYPYRLTKWDIVGMTKGLGLQLAKNRIIVNGIAPGIVATEMQNNLIKDGNNAFMPLNPLQRYALPEEIAELAIFMISDSCSFMVGQTIICDGGFTLN